MEFIKEGFASIISDNDQQYFQLLEGVVNSVDNFSIGKIIKTPNGYIVRLSTSDRKYVNSLISSINQLASFVNLTLTWSKSAKKNGTISFIIPTFVEMN